MKNLITYTISIVLILVFAWMIKVGMDREARRECLHEAQQASQYRLWYATDAVRAQCEAIGMTLPADNTQPAF